MKINQGIKKYIVITFGSALYAIAISLFLDPNSIVPGGVTGLSIILNRITNISTGSLIFIINIPILIIGVWKFGFKFILSSFYSIAMVSVFTNCLEGIPPITQEKLLAALAGGALLAISIGIIFRVGATTGGADIVVKLLRLKYPHLRTGSLFFLLDVVIVALSGIVFRNIELALYASIVPVIHAMLMDIVLYGPDEAKLVFIISDRYEEIAQRLMNELHLGVTCLAAQGAYTRQCKSVLMCVSKKQDYPRIENILRQEDEKVFLIVSSASEIYGIGYKDILDEKI